MLVRNNTHQHYNTVIIGAGPSGLTTGYCLKQKEIKYTILEASSRVANAWHNVWESFELAQQVKEIAVHGLDLSQSFPENYRLKRNEIINTFENYAKQHELAIQFNVRVTTIIKNAQNQFVIATSHGEFNADNIVLSIGARQAPHFPPCITPAVQQIYCQQFLHSAWFHNPTLFPKQANILVVGSGLSALSIADTLAHHDYQVTLACRYSDDTEIENNNAHLTTMPVKLSDLALRNVNNVGNLNDFNCTNGELFFSHCTQPIMLNTYDKVIFATGYHYAYDVLEKLFGPQTDVIEDILNHQTGVTKQVGIYTVGIPAKGEKTVTITQGSIEAQHVAEHIYTRQQSYASSTSQIYSVLNVPMIEQEETVMPLMEATLLPKPEMHRLLATNHPDEAPSFRY